MRKTSLKKSYMQLIVLCSFTTFCISDGFARRLANDRSESRSLKNARTPKLAQSAPPSKRVTSKKSQRRTNLRNTKERKIPINRQRQIKRGKINYPIGIYDQVGVTANPPLVPTPNIRGAMTSSLTRNDVFFPADYEFFKFQGAPLQGNFPKVTHTAAFFKSNGNTIQVLCNFMPYSKISSIQLNRLRNITGRKLLPTQIVNYGFFRYPADTPLNTFLNLMFKSKPTDIFFVGYMQSRL